ncbi:hypothetical protein EBR96_08850 [bacterium]|nr:hypothetical protein [bacterium]
MTLLQQIHELVDKSAGEMNMLDGWEFYQLEHSIVSSSCKDDYERKHLVETLNSFMQHWDKHVTLGETYREDKKLQFTRIYNACGFS